MRKVLHLTFLMFFAAAACAVPGGEVSPTPTNFPALTPLLAPFTGEPNRTPSLSSTPTSPVAFFALGKITYVKSGDLWVMAVPDGEPRRLTELGDAHSPRWSPSGEWLASSCAVMSCG